MHGKVLWNRLDIFLDDPRHDVSESFDCWMMPVSGSFPMPISAQTSIGGRPWAVSGYDTTQDLDYFVRGLLLVQDTLRGGFFKRAGLFEAKLPDRCELYFGKMHWQRDSSREVPCISSNGKWNGHLAQLI
jgi:hypothetical protein